MTAGGGFKHLEDGLWYLLGHNVAPEVLAQGEFIAFQALADGSDFACETSSLEPDSVDIYNRSGRKTGVKQFSSGVELSVFFDNISAAVLAYNGQSVYFERVNDYSYSGKYIIL